MASEVADVAVLREHPRRQCFTHHCLYFVTFFTTIALFGVIIYYCSSGRVEIGYIEGFCTMSPMIRDGRIDEARAACKVRLDNSTTGVADNCSGYLTVDEARRPNLFFWFFPAASGKVDAPVVL